MALPEEYPAMPAEVPGNLPVRVGPGGGVQRARLAHHQEAGQEEEGCDQHPLSSLSVMGECRVTAGQKTFFDQKCFLLIQYAKGKVLVLKTSDCKFIEKTQTPLTTHPLRLLIKLISDFSELFPSV